MENNSTVAVIGGGPGGYAAALYCAQLGKTVHLFEKKHLGGTCLNVGCIPTKAFVQASAVYSQIKAAGMYGITTDEPAVDAQKLQTFKGGVVNTLKGGVQGLLRCRKVEVHECEAKLKDAHTVVYTDKDGEKTLSADDIVLATGSSEINIPGFEPDGDKILNSTQMLDMTELPESIAIIGGGVIGVEFASVFAGFGKQVTIIEMTPRIIPTEDAQISDELKRALKKKGVKILTESAAKGVVARSENDITLSVEKGGEAKEITVSKILVCVGRRANIKDIGLEAAGVETNGKCIPVNAKMQTNVPNIYAVGDIVPSAQLAHVAYHEALVAARNIAGKNAEADYHAVPGCIFSHPECARVGMTQEQAEAAYGKLHIEMKPFGGNGKAMIEGETGGFIKLIFREDTMQAVGCSVIGPKACELIAEPSLAVALNLSAEQLAENINAHPSLSEIIGEAVGGAIGLPLHSV